MGTVKIELDLPNFEKEIELKVIINKDGVQSSTPLIDKKIDASPIKDSGTGWKQSMPSQVNSGTEILDAYGSTQSVVIPASQYNNCYASSGDKTPPSVTQAKVNSIPSSMMGTY